MGEQVIMIRAVAAVGVAPYDASCAYCRPSPSAPPDEPLLALARSGELKKAEVLGREVDRMLASDRLQDGMRAFFDDMLGFHAEALNDLVHTEPLLLQGVVHQDPVGHELKNIFVFSVF